MGGEMSHAQKHHVEELRLLGRKKYLTDQEKKITRHLSKSEAIKLLAYVWANCSSYPESGSLKVDTWRKIGAVLHQSPRAPPEILCLWKIAYTLIQTHADSPHQPLLDPPPYKTPSVMLATPLPPGAGFNPPSAPENLMDPDKQQTASPVPATLPPVSRLGIIRGAYQKALKNGDLSASDLSEAELFPVTYQQTAAGIVVDWEALPLAMVRELKKAAKDYGITSHYTRGLIHSVANAYRVLPQDWKDLFRMLLNGTQYVVFESEYKREAQNRANHPGSQWTAEQLFGEGAFATLNAQALTLNPFAFPIINSCVLSAMARVDESGTPIQSFSAIRQTATESYADFVNRLQVAIERQISNRDAANEILIKLAYEHANADCQSVLKPLVSSPTATLADFLKACRIVGTNAFQMDTLAAAIQKGNQPQGTCFNCGKPGHFKKQCRAPGGGAARPAAIPGAKPKTVCPKCKKGFHWANQCRSSQSNRGN